VFEPDALMAGALETATRIAGNAPLSTRQAKKSVSMSTQLDYHTGYQFEIEAYNRLVTTQDRLEGVRAFNEKRKPEFKGQ
jgi:enoyl-CoA hydratase/carnithine racemase